MPTTVSGRKRYCRTSLVEPSQGCNLKENGGLDLSGSICRESSSDPLEKYCAHAWTSIPEKYLEQDDLVIHGTSREFWSNQGYTNLWEGWAVFGPTAGRWSTESGSQTHKSVFTEFTNKNQLWLCVVWWRVSVWFQVFGINCWVGKYIHKGKRFPHIFRPFHFFF